MAKVTFKQFISLVSIEEPSDEQIVEIFGFGNKDKIADLKMTKAALGAKQRAADREKERLLAKKKELLAQRKEEEDRIMAQKQGNDYVKPTNTARSTLSKDRSAEREWADSIRKENVDEAKNHLGEKEYATYSGWKAAIKKQYPGKTIEWIGDKDIGEAHIDGQCVGEWGGDTGSVRNMNEALSSSSTKIIRAIADADVMKELMTKFDDAEDVVREIFAMATPEQRAELKAEEYEDIVELVSSMNESVVMERAAKSDKLGFFSSDDLHKIEKMNLDSAKAYMTDKVAKSTDKADPTNVRKAYSMIDAASTIKKLMFGGANFMLAHDGLKVA